MYVKFWIDNDFFVRNLEASVKALLAQVAFTKDFFFFTRQSGTLSFFFASGFFSEDFLTLLIFPRAKVFHKQRVSTREFCKVRDENKI